MEASRSFCFREAERMAKDKLMSYISTASLTSMASEQTLNGAAAISTMAGAGLAPLTPSHNSLSAGNVSMLPNGGGHHLSGVFGGNYTNGFHHHHHHNGQLPPPPDYGSQNSAATGAAAVGFPAPATSMNLDLSLASARLSNLSFSSPANGGGGSLGTGALANGSTMGELLNASVSGASHTLMADAGR